MSITLQEAVQRTVEHREIFHDEMLSLMRQIMSGEASPVMIAALTIGLRVKKETVGEIAAAAQVMREFATRVEVTGETAFCYLTESRPLLRHLAGRQGLRYLHRPANLEDVFLKLTGRDLRD